MCTVIFLPTHEHILFSSNRDENPLRPSALKPGVIYQDTLKIVCPVDQKAGGTWAGVNENGDVFILLNGAFKKHTPTGNYRKSRGIIVRELLANVFPVLKWRVTNLTDIEPFTIVAWCSNKLYEFIWDGESKYTRQLPKHRPHIWSSSTLYDRSAKQKRNDLFDNWTSLAKNYSKQELVQFLKSYTDKDNGFVMNRQDNLRTLSISTIEVFNDKAEFNYNDLITADETKVELVLN